MKTYLTNLIAEKGLEDELMTVDTSGTDYVSVHITTRDVVNFILGLPQEVQLSIRKTLIQIDFHNGDIMHFLNYIAQGIISIRKGNNEKTMQ